MGFRIDGWNEATEDKTRDIMALEQEEERSQGCVAASFRNRIKLCIDVPWACPCNNLSPVQAKIAKLGPHEKRKTTWLRPLLFWDFIDFELQGQI